MVSHKIATIRNFMSRTYLTKQRNPTIAVGHSEVNVPRKWNLDFLPVDRSAAERDVQLYVVWPGDGGKRSLHRIYNHR